MAVEENVPWTIREADPARDTDAYQDMVTNATFRSFTVTYEDAEQMLESGGQVTYVLEEDDTVIGFGDCFPRDRIAEINGAYIDDTYQEHSTENGGSRYRDLLETRLDTVAGADMVYSSAVTEHAKSQHTLETYGFEPFAIERIGDAPEIKFYRTAGDVTAPVFNLPDAYDPCTASITGQQSEDPGTAEYADGGFQVWTLPRTFGDLTTTTVGAITNGPDGVDALVDAAVRSDDQYTRVELPANNADTDVAVDRLTDHGFSLAGIVPAYHSEIGNYWCVELEDTEHDTVKMETTAATRGLLDDLGIAYDSQPVDAPVDGVHETWLEPTDQQYI